MKLLTVIVNYKTPDLAMEAVRALLPQLEGLSAQVTVVDNDSGDGSYEKMAEVVATEGWAPRVEVIASGHNGGFGFGNNVGIRKAFASDDPPEYVYLLNSDAYPKAGCVAGLLEFMDTHPTAGFAGSAVWGTDGSFHETAFRFPTAASELEFYVRLGPLTRLLEGARVVVVPPPEQDTEVDWVSGASLIMRKAALDEVGLFDEEFFLYFEETDLSYRGQQRGWSTWYLPSFAVAHVGSASTGAYTLERRRPTYWFDSRRRYFEKHLGRAGLELADAAFLTSLSLWKVRRLIERKERRDSKGLMRDFLSHKLGLPRFPD